MASVALRVFIFCLLHLCIQCDQMPVNTNVLAKIIQYFDDKLQPTSYDRPNQYSVVIRVPYQQCTEHFSLDWVFSMDEMKNAFSDFKTNSKRRFCEVIQDSVSLRAAKPSWIQMTSSSGETLHSEYVLVYPIDATKTSPLDKILRMPNDDQCVVLYTYNSPCIEKCINNKDDTILYGLSNWLKTRRTGIKAFIFQEMWRRNSTGVPADQQQQFTKINNLVPLYRCVKENNQMKCYKCGDAGSEMLHENCVS
ncbi:uncharacterized protein LOC125248688 isoform X3 [Megalobrama amblycephala]|uniref:uncharacterized protein LOC125248688 isoform X3 n=1 Tax=Megalobrama amblycephala TaxID=75352 RepID=UPI002013F360|nr:uncharacterized protein LOC125248688 isoform X3 [Megalobrama amblycephala]